MSSLLVFNRVYRLEIQAVMLVFSTHLVNCCPSTFSLTSPHSQSKRTKCGCGGGGGWGAVELCCRPYTAGVLHSVSDQIQNLQIVSPPLTKVTSKDDIKGLVSLKFLHPCISCMQRQLLMGGPEISAVLIGQS